MIDVLRWGRSAYETDAALAAERKGAEALGLTWAHAPATSPPLELERARALVITSKVHVTAEIVGRFRGGLIVTTTSGVDHIDLNACAAANVLVARCPMARRDPVVEHALMSAMGLMRRMPALLACARSGHWARGDLPGLAPRTLSGATVAVVGVGVIGSRMADLCARMGATVLGVDPAGVPPGVHEADLEAALTAADVVTLHCSLTASSHRLLDAAALDRLRPSAVVVNTARGPSLDLAEAAARVEAGRLRGVAADVFDVEPSADLASLSNIGGVWLTPHSSGYGHDLGERVADEVSRTLAAWVDGRPLPARV